MKNKTSIFFFGPSGIGKTTIAKGISEEFGLPMVEVSYLKSSGYGTHLASLEDPLTDKESRVQSELNFLRKRFTDFQDAIIEQGSPIVSDRSMLDNVAYYILKESKELPTCEVNDFIYLALKLMSTLNSITNQAIIFMPYGREQMVNGWKFEENGKRITNKHFQMMVSGIMEKIMESFSFKKKRFVSWVFGAPIYEVDFTKHPIIKKPLYNQIGKTPVLKLDVSHKDEKLVKKVVKHYITYLKWRNFFL